MENPGKQFALKCDSEGRVVRVIHDEDHVFSHAIIGKMLFSAVVAGDLDKILNFFLELKTKGTAIGWEINIATPEGSETFSFFGGLFDDHIGIAAATIKNDARLLFDELTRINNEQTNILRAVTKENAKIQTGTTEPGVSYYEELSRINNQLVNTQRELAKKTRELDELNKLKNQFLGIAAHDLSSPIGVILSYSELMLDKLNEPNKSDLLEFIKRIRKIGKFMLSLVNDLLDIANIESGQLELNLSEQDLRIVIREVINMNSIFAQAKSMEIIFEEPGLPVMLLIDRPKIEQVITNLLSNAIKYSFPGSAIFLRLENEGSMARVSVKDQGQGIREEELQKLFKPFQKTSTKSTAGEKSTGLGLLIVKKIVEAHHGEIGVTSKFEEGSVFFFKLPIPDESRIAKVYS